MGNVVKQPELKLTKQGKQFLSFSMATSSSYQDRQGEFKTDTEWHNITIWSNPLFAEDKINKGDLIYIDGSLKSYEYEGRRLWEVKAITWGNFTNNKNDDHISSSELLPAENIYPKSNVGQPYSWNNN